MFRLIKEKKRERERKRERKGIQIITVGNERGDITTDCIDIGSITGKYFEQLHAIKFGDVNEMDRFQDSLKDTLPKLTQKEQITSVSLNPFEKLKTLDSDGFTDEFYRTFKGGNNTILKTSFINFKRRDYFASHFMRPEFF